MFSQLKKMVSARALDLLAPPFCLHCKKFLTVRSVFCSLCKEKIIPVTSVILPISTRYQMTVFALSSYQEPIRSLIMAKTWSDIVASKSLAELMGELTHIRYQPVDFFVPVPLHWTRFAQRGYNQAEEMALVLAQKQGVSMAPLLKRIKRTHFQSTLALEMRKRNVQDAFITVADPSLYQGKHIVLVDDLMTSGSTLTAAARALIPLKPASLAAVVAARVV